jgi:hypothetical protein
VCVSEEARAALLSGADIMRTARELTIRQLTSAYVSLRQLCELLANSA